MKKRKASIMVRTRIAALSLGLGILLTGLLPGAATASAASASEASTAATGIELFNVATWLCLDSNARGDAYTLSCNNGDFQKWDGGAGWQRIGPIFNIATGMCLQGSNTSPGPVITARCDERNKYQRWTILDAGSPQVQIVNGFTGFCLDSNSAGAVYTLRCNNGYNQKWLRITR